MKERKESEEVSERDGFEDTHIVRLEQDMVKDNGFSGALQRKEAQEFVLVCEFESYLFFFFCVLEKMRDRKSVV